MDRKSQQRELTEATAKTRERYLKLNAEYDGFLEDAHKAEHGSQSAVDALKKANAIGPELTAALKEYRDAIEALVHFYEQS